MSIFSKSYEKYSDEQLMAAVAKGKESAFRQLYRRYADRMYRYFLRMLKYKVADAEDFTQELFAKLIEKPEAFDPSRRFSTWIYTLASNMIKNEYRRRDRRLTIEPINGQEVPDSPDCWIEELDMPVVREYLALAVQNLDKKHRQCFLLRYESQRSIQEISEILDCPEGTVKSRIYYAVRKLSSQLKVLNE